MRLTIGIPIYDSFKAETVASLLQTLDDLGRAGHEYHVTIKKGAYLDVNRELCVNAAIEDQSDYLIFIDADLFFPANGIRKLIELDKDIVGGNYYEKALPLISTVRVSDGNGGFVKGGVDFPDAPFQVGVVATGFMAIKMRRVLDNMVPPFFSYNSSGNGRTFIGEDVHFCMRALDCGLEVWCDPTIPIYHIGDFPYGRPEDAAKIDPEHALKLES
jgi:hypothetical protein